MGSERIDYISIRVPGMAEPPMQPHVDLAMLALECRDEGGGREKCYSTKHVYDRITNTNHVYFNVWGKTADRFFDRLPAEILISYCARLDYRIEATNPDIDVLAMGKYALEHARKRERVDLFTGPLKSKSDGRDTGGVGVSFGGRDSNRRFTFYRRGYTELPAVEAKLARRKVRVICEEAGQLLNHAPGTVHKAIRRAGEAELSNLVQKHLHCSLYYLTGDAPLIREEDTTVPIGDYLQQQAVWLVGQMSANQQRALIAELANSSIDCYQEMYEQVGAPLKE